MALLGLKKWFLLVEIKEEGEEGFGLHIDFFFLSFFLIIFFPSLRNVGAQVWRERVLN